MKNFDRKVAGRECVERVTKNAAKMKETRETEGEEQRSVRASRASLVCFRLRLHERVRVRARAHARRTRRSRRAARDFEHESQPVGYSFRALLDDRTQFFVKRSFLFYFIAFTLEATIECYLLSKRHLFDVTLPNKTL